jgi:hypothetical protein
VASLPYTWFLSQAVRFLWFPLLPWWLRLPFVHVFIVFHVFLDSLR